MLTYTPYDFVPQNAVTFDGTLDWGNITGNIFNQLDLVEQLNTKELSLGNPTVSGYVLSSDINGNRTWIPVVDSSTDIVTNTTSITLLRERTEIESMFKIAEATMYKEFTYVDGKITDIDIYTNSGKGTQLFSKNLGYDLEDKVVSITITDLTNLGTIIKTIAYNGTAISSVTSTYTP